MDGLAIQAVKVDSFAGVGHRGDDAINCPMFCVRDRNAPTNTSGTELFASDNCVGHKFLLGLGNDPGLGQTSDHGADGQIFAGNVQVG